MINKKNIWFLTLFSLILVLSVYYITMPSELLLTNLEKNQVEKEKTVLSVEESDTLSVLRLESDEKLLEDLDSLKLILSNSKSTVDEKNKAFEKMKQLNINKGEETTIEEKIEKEFTLKSFVKINEDQIKIIINSSEHDKTIANKIMRFIQKDYETKKYIIVEFK